MPGMGVCDGRSAEVDSVLFQTSWGHAERAFCSPSLSVSPRAAIRLFKHTSELSGKLKLVVCGLSLNKAQRL